jgi:RNA polymerase sigma-70 factor (ECF subfamily)
LPDDRVACFRARKLLDELLAAMPPPLRRVLVLAELEQCSVPEIAEYEGIPLGTAASRLRLARERFGALLGKHDHPFREVAS